MYSLRRAAILLVSADPKEELGSSGLGIGKSVGCGCSLGCHGIIFVIVEVEKIRGVVDGVTCVIHGGPGQGNLISIVADVCDRDSLVLSADGGPRSVEKRKNFSAIDGSIIDLHIIDKTVEVLPVAATTNPEVVRAGSNEVACTGPVKDVSITATINIDDLLVDFGIVSECPVVPVDGIRDLCGGIRLSIV